MGKRVWKLLVLFLLVDIFAVSAAHAAVSFKYGADFRLRQEYFDDHIGLGLINLNSGNGLEQNFIRLKTSLWGQWSFDKKDAVFVKITSEPRVLYETGRPGLCPGRNLYR